MQKKEGCFCKFDIVVNYPLPFQKARVEGQKIRPHFIRLLLFSLRRQISKEGGSCGMGKESWDWSSSGSPRFLICFSLID